MGKYYDFDHSIIDIAEDFYNAYERCREGRNWHIDEYGRHCGECVNVPAIVNGAFSIELFLKSLSPLSNKELRKNKHELAKLFLTLEEEDQASIRKAVEKRLPSLYTFDSGLTIINNSFTFWRYIHLKPNFGYGLNVTLNLLDVYLKVIRDCALKKKDKDKEEQEEFSKPQS